MDGLRQVHAHGNHLRRGAFLTNRYDAPTGTLVPVRERVGLLDRKLRAVSENTDNEADWLKWAARAFQSSYGYEFQGDSLLIARINALMTFAECFHDRWGRFPGADKCKAIADIIAWNLWQMDGLTDAIPYRTLEKYEQTYIAGWLVSQVSISETPKRCHIYDWRKRRKIEYLSLKEKEDNAMKFDFIIGNPPYQEESKGANANDTPIYHFFYNGAFSIADKVELITPRRFLFNAGGTPKSWNEQMLSDEHLKVLMYEQKSDKIFRDTSISGGVVVIYRDVNQQFGAIDIFTPYDELNSIIKKVSSITQENMSSIVSNRGQYRYSDLAFLEHPQEMERTADRRIAPSAFERMPELFTEL